MRAWIDRTNDGLSGMPAEGVSLPPTKGGTSARPAGPAYWISSRMIPYVMAAMCELLHTPRPTFILPADAACPRRRGDRVTVNIKRREFITLLGGVAALANA